MRKEVPLTEEQLLKHNISKALKGYQKEHNMTQFQLADYLGVAQSTISKWVSDDPSKMPTLRNISDIANKLGISCDEMILDKLPENVETIRQTGLTNKAVQALKHIKENRDDPVREFAFNAEAEHELNIINLILGDTRIAPAVSESFLSSLADRVSELIRVKRDNDRDPYNDTTIAGIRFQIMTEFINMIDRYTDTIAKQQRKEKEKGVQYHA
jgi:transcriptional regulator with XRE-family HTH domain